MTARIKIDPERQIGSIDRNIFGGFAEHIGRCIYTGMFDEDSPLSDENGFRTDVLEALRRLRMPLVRYPGGNFVSGYRWRDGVGPQDTRPARSSLAWNAIESNRFGTDEFVTWCRKLGTEPYLVVNCGDGDQREAQDWVEYCNGTRDTEPVRLRRANGYAAPHNVRYWGIGNEVMGHWQIGYKTPLEYARACREFGKVMKCVDPAIKTIACACIEGYEWIDRTALILEHAAPETDYLSIHWYVGNKENDFARYMTVAEKCEEMLSAYQGLVRAIRLDMKMEKEFPIAVDEWNVWYRTKPEAEEEIYNLEDALVVALQMNSFIRHCSTVKMANLAQIVNVIAPVVTSKDSLLIQSIFHPFEMISREAGSVGLDASVVCDTFQGGDRTGCTALDVSATLDPESGKVAVFVVNRTMETVEAEIVTQTGTARDGLATVVNAPDIKAANTFESPDQVVQREACYDAAKGVVALEPHSFTAISYELA